MNPIRSAKFSVSVSSKAPHYHDCHQLLYLTEGCAEITINGKTYDVHPGTLILISRLEMHSIRVKSERYERYELRIDPSYHSKSGNHHLFSVFINRPEGFCHANDPGGEEVESILKRIVEEHKARATLGDEMLGLLSEALLITLYRRLPQLFPTDDRKTELVNRIRMQLENDLTRRYTLAEIAAENHLSEYHLSHIFKSVTGYPVMGYLLSLRLAAAKRLLTKTDLPVGEIVESCGFSDSSNFSRTFRAATGLSPSEFRGKYRIPTISRV